MLARVQRTDRVQAERMTTGACESLAINVKAIGAARSVGMGNDHLVCFSAIAGLHKTFAAISRKAQGAAISAISRNLETSRQLTKVGGDNIAVMYDGAWQKRCHNTHDGIGTVLSLDSGLCLDFEFLSNFCLACSRHKALPDEE